MGLTPDQLAALIQSSKPAATGAERKGDGNHAEN